MQGDALQLGGTLVVAPGDVVHFVHRDSVAGDHAPVDAIVAAAAGLVLVGGHAELPTLTALTLSRGIAADDTIHVLARWTRERARGANAIDGARAAVQGALPALLLTTITLSSAFGVLLPSSVPTIRTFGLLGAVTIATAFVADVLLLPPLLVATSRSRRRV